MYEKSPRWKDHSVTAARQYVLKDIFEACDKDSVDGVIWVNKSRYLIDAAYRLEIWQRLRSEGFDTVVAPSRTRPLLLDDLCMLAAAPVHTIAPSTPTCIPAGMRSRIVYTESYIGLLISPSTSSTSMSICRVGLRCPVRRGPSENRSQPVRSPSGLLHRLFRGCQYAQQALARETLDTNSSNCTAGTTPAA